MVAKANRILGLVKRTCKDTRDVRVRKLLFCALVRPVLEYASNLWSPYTIMHKSLVENVQRRATKFILNYPKDLTYADRLMKVNILPLEFRRDISHLCYFLNLEQEQLAQMSTIIYVFLNQDTNREIIIKITITF